jgi:hypothetical protein
MNIAAQHPETFKRPSMNSRHGGFIMNPFSKKFTTTLLSVLVLAATTAPAFADGASSRAKARLAQLRQHEVALTQIKSQIEAFKIKTSYCKPVHRQDKRADETALKNLTDRAAQEMRGVSNIRRILITTITRNQTARTALDQEIPGGTGTIVDGSFFRPFNNLRRDINIAKGKKTNELSGAPTRSCGQSGTSVQPPKKAFVVSNPLTEVVMTAEYTDVTIPTLPKQFCYEDERRALKRMLSELRSVARTNAVNARELSEKLRALKSSVSQKKNAAYEAADAAAKSGDRETMNNQAAQKRAYDAALKKLDAEIEKALAAMRKWRGVVDKIDAESAKVDGIPVVDCLGAVTLDGMLGATAFPEIYKGVDNISLKEVELIDINITKTCFQEVKDSFVMAASTELSKAAYNQSQWNNRLDQIASNLDLLYFKDGVSAETITKMEGARNEARLEAAKWAKIKAQAEAVEAKAKAIVVEDCTGVGGATEIGRLIPGFGQLSGDIPVPDLKPYDLPEVPEIVCTWEELQALIARAATAREVAANNRSEWGKRMVALGQLLFVDNTTTNPRGPEYEALLDARAQNEYWSKQQDVAHKVYWALKEMKVSKCEDPKKSSMSLPENTTGGSLDDALRNARNTAPTFNGGSNSSGYGPYGNGYPPVYGYPDFDKIRLQRQMYGQPGFDGSEAEDAVRDAVDRVERKPQDDENDGHSSAGGYEYKTQNETAQPASAEVEGKPKNPAYTSTKTSGATTPTSERVQENMREPANASPTNNQAEANSERSGSYGIKVPRGQLTTRGALSTGETRQEECQTCGTKRQTTPQPAYGVQTQSRTEATVLSIPSSNNGGKMIQVAPPTLVITPQGGSARDYGSAAEFEAATSGPAASPEGE